MFAQLLCQDGSHLDSATYHHHIDVIRRALEEDVTYIAPHHIAFYTHAVSHFTYLVENLLVKNPCQLFVRVHFHILCKGTNKK